MTSGSLPDDARSDPGTDGPVEGSAVNGRRALSFPRPPRSLVAVVESLVIGAALPAVGFLINRTDPFFLARPFSWIVLPPLLAGIRHGFAAGCASASVMAFALVLSVRYHVFGVDAFPGEALLGMVLVTMIVGHVSDVWHRDAERIRAQLESAGRRANEFARAHFLLSLSHERLEEQNQGAANLRDALARIRQLRATTPGESWAVLAQPMMSILSRYAMLEAGSLISLDDEGRPSRVLASIGRSSPVDPLDPVLRDAFRSRELFYVQGGVSSELLSPTKTPRLLAAVPMVDAGGRLHGMLCVQEMPFMAFHKKNLEALALLTGHFADVATVEGRDFDPDGERLVDFNNHLWRALYDSRVFDISSVVAVLGFKDGAPIESVADVLVAGALRPRDSVCRARHGSTASVIWMLLPMADAPVGQALSARMESLVQREKRQGFAETGGVFAFRVIADSDTVHGVRAHLAGALEALGN